MDEPSTSSEGKITGRPKGSKNKNVNKINWQQAQKSAKSLAYFILSDSQYRSQLIMRCRSGTVNPSIEAMLWYYVLGKPTETVQLNVEDGRHKDVSQLSDAELQEELILLRKKGEEVLNKGELN